MKAGDLIRKAEAVLAEAGVEGPGRDARVLMGAVLGLEPGRLILESDRAVSASEAQMFQRQVAARAQRQPVAQIVGFREFWGRRFRVTRDVLDPRPDTETLVDLALEGAAPARLLDLGTGSGALAVSLLAEWPGAEGVATDISDAALAVAAENAAAHRVSERLALVVSDWWSAVEGVFDLVVSNPPYIAEAEMAGLDPEVRDWEPALALTPGGDGLAAYLAIAAGLGGRLAPGGRGFFEIGAGQAAAVSAIFRDAGWNDPVIHRDLAGKNRVIGVKRAN